MSIFTSIKGWFAMLLQPKAKEKFSVETMGSEQMRTWIAECMNVYQGNPCWIDAEDHIDTVNFAKSICSETARLATLGIGIKVDGSVRADWLQKQIDRVYYQLRNWIEYGCAYGTIAIKPNGKTIQLYTPEEFEITHHTDGKVDGIVFHNWEKVGDKWFTRLEYHSVQSDVYTITNKCYVGTFRDDTKKAVNIKATPWADLAEEARILNLKGMLFGIFRTPHANNIDLDSPYGLPVFSEALQELRDLDVAYSRNAKEILDSKRTVLLDSDTLTTPGKKRTTAVSAASLGLPDVVKNVQGDGKELFYQEINPELNTDVRISGINALLNQIGYKSGYSNGHFVFNESSGIQTATQVEADQQRTIQLIKDVRDKLEECMQDLIYALNAFADLYGYAPAGLYEVVFDFGDITYNKEEDRARWWGYVQAGKVPAWMFFVKFEGMTEKDAKSMTEEARPKEPTLFGGEE